MEKTEKEILNKFHNKDLHNPFYLEGFNSDSENNPHQFPKEISEKRLIISCVKGPLSEKQKNELMELNELFEETSWNKWSLGNYRRKKFNKIK